MSWYSWFKPYLSESTASDYAKPLQSFYEMVFFEAVEKEGASEELKAVKKLFSDCLEVPEGQEN